MQTQWIANGDGMTHATLGFVGSYYHNFTKAFHSFYQGPDTRCMNTIVVGDENDREGCFFLLTACCHGCKIRHSSASRQAGKGAPYEKNLAETKNVSNLLLKPLVMSFAGKNLKYLRKLRGWTQEEFANKLNIKRSLVGAYEEERAEPRLEVMETICHLFSISLEDFLFKDLSVKTGGSYLESRRNSKLLQSGSAEIKLVPIKAAAGYLNGYGDPEFIDELNTFTLPMLAPGNYRAFEILGDSMLPTPSGSVIVGEKIDDWEEVKNSNTYVVLSKQEGVVYKRVLRNAKSRNKLTLLSDNPVYEPYHVNAEDVLEIWRAVYIIQKATPAPRWDVSQLAGMVNTLQEQVSSLKKKLN
jgi:transcriptional regulator with XRE-family HTH domain